MSTPTAIPAVGPYVGPHVRPPVAPSLRRTWSSAVLCALLGLCLLAGAVSYTALAWQRRVTLESERGVAVATLSEARVSEALRTTVASLQIMADRSIGLDEWAPVAIRAARTGGRIGSASLLAPDGTVLASTEPRNRGLRLAPEAFGGGWRSARIGIGRLFTGRDLYDRRPARPETAADFVPVSVPVPQDGGFVVGTVSIRSLNASLAALLDDADHVGVGLYWRDGTQVHVVGRSPVPPVLPPVVVERLQLTDAWRDQPPTSLWFGGTRLACRGSPADPFVLCAQWGVPPLADDLFGSTGGALLALLGLVALMMAASVHYACADLRREQEREAFRIGLADSEQRQAAAIEASGGIVWECDRVAHRVRYYGCPIALLGPGTPTQETRSQAFAHFQPEDAAALATALRQIGNGTEPRIDVLVRPIGRPDVWLRVTARPDAGKPHTVIGTIVDVSAAVATNERYRSIFREVAQPILLLDQDGRVEELNPATEAAFAAPAATLRGRPFEELVQFGVEDAAGTLHAVGPATLAAAGRMPAPTLVGCRADGSVFPLAVATGAWSVAGVQKIAAVVRDLSSDKEIERCLMAAKRASDHAAQVKTDFLSTMSHEIRTPLNGVIGMAGLLTETPLDPTQAHYVTVLQDSADHLLQLINDILDISKLESTQLELEPGPFDVADLVQSAIDIVSARAREKSLVLGATVAGDAPRRVIGDAGRIRQVLLNLLGNAVKFTERGGVTVEVTAAPGATGRVGLSFVVRDSGVGIPPDGLERLFVDFAQLDGSIARRYGGTGLGLAISQRLVERMGGEIRAESRPGEGSMFRFTLQLPPARSFSAEGGAGPASPTAHAPGSSPGPASPGSSSLGSSSPGSSSPGASLEPLSPESSSPGARSAPVPDTPGLRVLLAEDNPTNQLIARRMLESMGYRVHVASNGREALEAVRQHRFDAVLMDVMMPEMDGISASRAIRAEETGREVPILAVTANAFEHDRRACLEAGMNGFLSKPFNRASLRAALAEATRGRVGGSAADQAASGPVAAAATG